MSPADRHAGPDVPSCRRIDPWNGCVFADKTAGAWGRALVTDGSLQGVREALNVAAGRPNDEVLELDEGACALAAGEAVAAAAGAVATPDAFPKGLLAWVTAHPEVGTPEMRALASTAVHRAASSMSEISDQWERDGQIREWNLTTESLVTRLDA